MVFFMDMCNSELGKYMCSFRSDRPSEWQMDEFIGKAEDMNLRIIELERQREELLEAAKAVVTRWDTPNWKDAEPTAAVIGRLRATISKCSGSAP